MAPTSTRHKRPRRSGGGREVTNAPHERLNETAKVGIVEK
jgi:hypothetical protein